MLATDVTSICEDLQRFQRQKVWYRKTRIMVENRLRATVAGSLGYESRMNETQRAAMITAATKLIKGVLAGDECDPDLEMMVRKTALAVEAFKQPEVAAEKQMVQLAKQLPVAEWLEQEEQRGFGLSSLATVIGESGDLSNYAGPAKLWKRLGCAPYQQGDKTYMGATWRSGKHGKLSAEEWEQYGYNPRRRSIAFLIGECLIKANKSIYRERYDTAKEAMQAAHPDYSKLRCHRHGMLLATKLLLKNLWIEWHAAN